MSNSDELEIKACEHTLFHYCYKEDERHMEDFVEVRQFRYSICNKCLGVWFRTLPQTARDSQRVQADLYQIKRTD